MNKFIISGYKQSGKSTLIKRLLKETNRPVTGFFTEKFPDRLTGDGLCPIYIYPVMSDPIFDDEHLIGLGGNGTHYTNTEVFDRIGVELLNCQGKNTLIVMDELGFLEGKAERFRSKVFEVLASENPVVIIMKQKMRESFMQELRAFPMAEYFELTLENRDGIFEYIKEKLAE